MTGLDKQDANMKQTVIDTVSHGHSTPHMAAMFAKKTNVKRLILNHFSARYRGDPAIESMSIMYRIEKQAMKQAEMEHDTVLAAWDFMSYNVPQRDSS